MTWYRKTIRGTRYRRWKTYDQTRLIPTGPRGPWHKTIYGRTHIQFYDREMKEWRYVCGKMDDYLFGGGRGYPLEDPNAQITCRNCLKHTELVDALDGEIPDLMDFQD